jgi:hypothetical protein
MKRVMYIIIGGTFGAYLGNVLFVCFDYKNNPGLYEMYSAPWYAKIIADSLICGAILLVAIAIQLFVCHKIKKNKS